MHIISLPSKTHAPSQQKSILLMTPDILGIVTKPPNAARDFWYDELCLRYHNDSCCALLAYATLSYEIDYWRGGEAARRRRSILIDVEHASALDSTAVTERSKGNDAAHRPLDTRAEHKPVQTTHMNRHAFKLTRMRKWETTRALQAFRWPVLEYAGVWHHCRPNVLTERNDQSPINECQYFGRYQIGVLLSKWSTSQYFEFLETRELCWI